MMHRILTVVCLFACMQCSMNNTEIPSDSTQLLLVLTDSVNATKGELVYFNKSTIGEWKKVEGDIPIVVGRKGLAWGIGLHSELSFDGFTQKKEGDGRSPAGIFYLGAVFGYEDNIDVKMPFIHVDDVTECVDDRKSNYYNQVIKTTDLVQINQKPDWDSSEQMREYGEFYEQGIIVYHNMNPIEYGKGSCIFIHNWKESDDTTAGCTAMEPQNLSKVINWLDESTKPVFVQLTKQAHAKLKSSWGLP